MSNVVTGVVAFSNVTKHDFYNGKDTGNYTLTVTMDADEAEKLSSKGVVIKDYEGKSQRKFKSQYDVPVVDTEDSPVTGEIPYGSVVRILYTTGNPHPQYGVPVYMNRVRLVERAENEGGADGTPEEF